MVGNRECNTQRGSIEQLYIALGIRHVHFKKKSRQVLQQKSRDLTIGKVSEKWKHFIRQNGLLTKTWNLILKENCCVSKMSRAEFREKNKNFQGSKILRRSGYWIHSYWRRGFFDRFSATRRLSSPHCTVLKCAHAFSSLCCVVRASSEPFCGSALDMISYYVRARLHVRSRTLSNDVKNRVLIFFLSDWFCEMFEDLVHVGSTKFWDGAMSKKPVRTCLNDGCYLPPNPSPGWNRVNLSAKKLSSHFSSVVMIPLSLQMVSIQSCY